MTGSRGRLWLGFSQMIADYSWFTTYLKRLEQVTPDDVQRIAQQYLRPQQRITGIYLPAGGSLPGDVELDETLEIEA